eukprot:gene19173-25782_t
MLEPSAAASLAMGEALPKHMLSPEEEKTPNEGGGWLSTVISEDSLPTSLLPSYLQEVNPEGEAKARAAKLVDALGLGHEEALELLYIARALKKVSTSQPGGGGAPAYRDAPGDSGDVAAGLDSSARVFLISARLAAEEDEASPPPVEGGVQSNLGSAPSASSLNTNLNSNSPCLFAQAAPPEPQETTNPLAPPQCLKFEFKFKIRPCVTFPMQRPQCTSVHQATSDPLAPPQCLKFEYKFEFKLSVPLCPCSAPSAPSDFRSSRASPVPQRPQCNPVHQATLNPLAPPQCLKFEYKFEFKLSVPLCPRSAPSASRDYQYSRPSPVPQRPQCNPVHQATSNPLAPPQCLNAPSASSDFQSSRPSPFSAFSSNMRPIASSPAPPVPAPLGGAQARVTGQPPSRAKPSVLTEIGSRGVTALRAARMRGVRSERSLGSALSFGSAASGSLSFRAGSSGPNPGGTPPVQ